MTRKKKESQQTATITEPIAMEGTVAASNIKTCLEEINSYLGVLGYIMRNTTSASIDLKDPTRVIDFAMLSSASIDAGMELSEVFDLGSMKHILVEGKGIRMLSMVDHDNRISVFMEKQADVEKILKRLQSL